MQGKDPFFALLGLFILGTVFLFCGESSVTSPPPVALEKPVETPLSTQKIIESRPSPVPPPASSVPASAVLKKKIDELLMGTTMMFRINSATLLPEGNAVLNSVATILQEDPTAAFEVGGHTDNVGSEPTNQILSAQRAKAVIDYLISKGIVADRLASKGYGASRPITENSTEEGRQQNRQIEFSIRTKGAQS
ncbi:MAG: OmpA family protein [Nitrospira sp.]|nr:MAG: OmpA family protein [Nitrospira sp.]